MTASARVVAIALAASGCVESLAPDVGPPVHAQCTNVDPLPDRDVRFTADIVPIFAEYHCRKCHTPGGSTPIGFLVGGLSLESYATLRAGGARSMAAIVIAGKPCDSVLVQKVSAGPPFGARMPLDGPPYLDDEDVELIASWIAKGAHDD
jgi:hypothetical protein